MTQWACYEIEPGQRLITLKRAPKQLPWQCPVRFSGMSTNCGCARFDDGSCVPPHVYPEFARRRDAGQPFRDVKGYKWTEQETKEGEG
jgi:hypothetical protein